MSGKRRSWVLLDSRANTRCVVKSADGPVLAKLGAYELAAVRDRELLRHADAYFWPLPQRVMTAKRVSDLLSGTCCYAFYAKPSHAVKIGLATDVLRRWSELEHTTGMLLQLLMVWKTNDPRGFEKKLHTRFAAHRRLGEWFSADEVLAELINEVNTFQRPNAKRGLVSA